MPAHKVETQKLVPSHFMLMRFYFTPRNHRNAPTNSIKQTLYRESNGNTKSSQLEKKKKVKNNCISTIYSPRGRYVAYGKL